MLIWLHVNMVNRDNECSGLLLCNHLVLNSQPFLTWEPSEIISRGGTQILLFFGGGPDFANLPGKGSHILTILTRTSLANENLKVSTPPSDDFWIIPYPLYLFLTKLPAWFTCCMLAYIFRLIFGLSGGLWINRSEFTSSIGFSMLLLIWAWGLHQVDMQFVHRWTDVVKMQMPHQTVLSCEDILTIRLWLHNVCRVV